MPLEQATRLGVYEVLGPLGAGGMGEVYRARDTRLGRDVAIKVLPEGVARDASRLVRFEREARFLASLNHPGIAAVYGFEEAAGVPYIVMELVPGETLTAKLTTGALSLEESLSIARQIAEALEAAHEKGVLHRDLKPANIKVTPEGKAKVLDLGLAKAFDVKAPSDEDMSRSPTVVLEETRPGVILGTAEFMSPEQARGKEVDKRTDIWAFGCILYEMLSGRRAFTGETISDVMVAILSSDPNWGALPRETPPRIRDLLTRCLEKDASRRLRDVGDARIEIDLALAERKGEPVKPIPGSAFRRRWLAFAVVAIAVSGGATLFLWHSRSSPPSAAVPAQKYLAVLPFRDLSGLPGGQLVGDGLVATVSARLAKVPGIQVVTPAAAVAASDKETNAYKIAKDLGANLILRGAFQRDHDLLRITFSVLNAEEKVQLAGDEVTGSASDIFAIQDRLADKVASSLKLPSGGKPSLVPTGLETAAEQDRYLQAVGHLQRYDKASSVDEAIGILQGLAAEKPAAALINAALGRGYLYKFNLTRERKWVDLAIESSARALQLDPDLPEVDVTLGELRARTGDAKEAIAAFRRALAAQPANYEALLGLAAAYHASENPSEARATYRRAIQLQPFYWTGYSKAAGFYFSRGEYKQAEEMFRRVTELAPDNARAFSNLGATLQSLGDLPRALEAHRKSLALEPTDLAHSNIGTAEFFLGNYLASADAFRNAVRLTPARFQNWANLGDAYRWSKKFDQEAVAAYERAILLARQELRTNPRDAAAHSALALCLAKTGQMREARKHAGEALAIGPRNPELLYDAAVVANLDRKPDQAIELLRRATQAGYNRALLSREPEFSNLRNEESFQEVLRGNSRRTS